jgi:5-methyltetrahydropteroyltriglutamate--homocysteine methyltransferase
MRPPGTVDGPIGHGTLDLPAACAKARQLATRPLKFTLTGPHMLAKTLIDRHYGGSAEKVALAIADVLAEQVAHCDAAVIQVDEANLPGSPEEAPWAAEAINRVLRAVKTRAAVHLCFGNYGGQSIQKGGWDRLMGYLNALQVDHVVMENAHRPAEELAVFRNLRPEIGMGLGVVDIKRTDVESADDIARAIERAETVIGPGRVRYIHPDCGFWMLKRNIVDAKIRALVAGRDLFEGRTVRRAA